MTKEAMARGGLTQERLSRRPLSGQTEPAQAFHCDCSPAFHFLYVTLLRKIGGSWQTSNYSLSPAFLSLPTTPMNIQMMFTLATSPSMTPK